MKHLSTMEHPWGKPFTNKRYLHPPMAEQIVTMWPSSMILFGEIPEGKAQHSYVSDGYGRFSGECIAPSTGVIFTLKRDHNVAFFKQRQNEQYRQYLCEHDFMPYQAVTYHTRRDGIPIHRFYKDLDGIRFHEEAFCDTKRVPTAYIKVTVENTFGVEQTVELGALVRSGAEYMLIGCNEPDGYLKTEQSKERWLRLPRFEKKNGVLTNGTYSFYFDSAFSDCHSEEVDLCIPFALKPYEKKEFFFSLTRNEKKPLAYRSAKAQTAAFWKQELGKAENIPDKAGIRPLFYNLLAQNLQMFCYPTNAEYVLVRQGGLQRYTWPEATYVLQSLAKIGGYSDYLDQAFHTYFDIQQEKTGPNVGRIFVETVPWISRTASVLESFGVAAQHDPLLYHKYQAPVMAAFRWIEQERAKTNDGRHGVRGLMPAGISTDHHFADAQQWSFSDAPNLFGYERLLQAAKQYQSPYLSEIQAAYDDYLSVLKNLVSNIAKEQANSEFLYIPRDPRNIPELEQALNKDPFLYSGPYHLLAIGAAGYGTPEAKKIIHTYQSFGQAQNDLLYPTYRSIKGVGRTWYLSVGEFLLFQYDQHTENRDAQTALIDSQLTYGVSNEYYLCERYDDHDAYIAPWMPNASANGRLLLMLFDFYGSKKAD